MQPDPASFPETADIETSTDAYAGRFAGPSGAWMLDVQEKTTLAHLARLGAPGSALDVGGGHGQLAHPLTRDGYRVTVVGSHPDCAHRIQALINAGTCRFEVGNVIHLPCPDQSFDAVLCFRLVTHCERWPQLIAELCRTARRSVTIDYPTSTSLNAIAPMLFKAKKKLEKNTRTWTLFTHRQIDEAFAAHGFKRTYRDGQFFFPMVLHRMLKSRALSNGLESATRFIGLNNLLGSPVIATYTRT